MTKPAPNLGSVIVHDPRLNIDRLLTITKLELRDRALWIEATGKITTDGEIRDDDVITLRDPDGDTVLRTWLDIGERTVHVRERERFTLLQYIGIGGQRPVVMGDSSLDIDL